VIWGDDAYDPPSERVKSVQDKLQSMIDTYCEHEEDFDAITISPIKKCSKCKEYYK